MQTQIDLRTVRKSANDIKHGIPQAVSPFHPPVKLDEKPQLKRPIVQEEAPKRQSSRLRNRKTGQTTLDDYPQLAKVQSTAKTNGKKRATTTQSAKEHKAKKQRVLEFPVNPTDTTNEQLVEKGKTTVQTNEPVVEHATKKRVRRASVQEEEVMIEHDSKKQHTPEKEPIPQPHASGDEQNAETQSVAVQEEEVISQSEEPVAELGSKSEPAVQLEPKKETDIETVAPEVELARFQEEKVAPWKRTIFIESDKARLQDEKDTLMKLRNDLDITIMFQTANNRIPMFHKIQPMLRNTTKKNITMSHVAKILYLAPILYRIQPKELPVSGKMIETYSVELGAQWKAPLSGKQLEERKNILADKMESYFAENKGKLVIPEIELPKIEKVVDKEKWLKTANMPSGMRDLLQLEERRKEEADKAKATLPPITGTGSAKDRRKALMDRIRAKSKK